MAEVEAPTPPQQRPSRDSPLEPALHSPHQHQSHHPPSTPTLSSSPSSSSSPQPPASTTATPGHHAHHPHHPRRVSHLGLAPLTFSPLFANKVDGSAPSQQQQQHHHHHHHPAGTSDESSVGYGDEDGADSPPIAATADPTTTTTTTNHHHHHHHTRSSSTDVVTGINITSVLENPRHQITLLEDVWTAEAEYVVPPCLHPKYAYPPTRADFEPYVKRLHKAHEAAGRAHRSAPWTKLRHTAATRASSTTAPTTTATPPAPPATSSAIVPRMFFDEGFNLRVPATFEAALGVSAAGLQQRLSHYLDTVEDEISRHVRDRATDFVAALDTLQNLETNVGSACSVIAELQSRMKRLRKVLAEDALRRLAQQRRQARLKTVREKLRVVKGLTVALANIDGLHQDGSYAAALDGLDEAHAVMRQQLEGVVAVASIRQHFGSLRRRIMRTMTDKFTTAAKRFVTLGPSDSVLGGGGGGGGGSGSGGGADLAGSSQHEVLQAALDMELRPLMEGLVRVGGLCDALDTYSSALRRELKLFVRTNVRESLRSLLPSAHLPGANDSVVGYIDDLTPQSFALVMSQLMDALLSLFRRAVAIHELVERVMDVVETTSTSNSGGTGAGAAAKSSSSSSSSTATTVLSPANHHDWRVSVDGLRSASSGVLAVVNATIQKHVTQLLAARTKYHLSIRVAEMRDMCVQVNEFADAANRIGGPSTLDDMQLWDEVRKQMKAFLDRAHERNKEDIERLIVSEVWGHTRVAGNLQLIANDISRRGREEEEEEGEGEGHDAGAGAGDVSLTSESDVLVMDGTSFKVVNSCLMLVKMMGAYLSLAQAVPAVAGDASTKLAELLRAFNVRARDLVLRAGALKLTGATLKKINTSHLARCSSSLGAIHAAIPCVREAMSRHASRLAYGSSALGSTAVSAQLIQLDAVASDLAAHRRGIVDKIVGIVMDITDSCCTEFDRIDWNENSPDRPSRMMSGLTRSLDRLRTSLVKYLTPDQLDAVFCNIAVQMSTKIPVVFSRVAVSSLTIVGKSRLEIDIRYLLIALRKCPGLGDARGGGGGGAESPVVIDEDINMGQAALISMESWVARQYPGVGGGGGGGGGGTSATPPLEGEDGVGAAAAVEPPAVGGTAGGAPVPPPRTSTTPPTSG